MENKKNIKNTPKTEIEVDGVKYYSKKEEKLEWVNLIDENGNKSFTWEEAKNEAKKQGLRLPTVQEAFTAYHDGDTTDTDNTYYWTSTTCANSTDYAWIIDFGYGYATDNNKTNNNHARCVR